MDVHLLDGTYELFRYHFAHPPRDDADGKPVAAVRGVIGSVIGMLDDGVTHIGVATDHIVESFRNDLWPGYKTSEGVPPELLAQFPVLEDALRDLGVTVWPMVELEADDALGSAAAMAAADPRVGRVFICTPDKDLAQCVRDGRVVVLDRRKRETLDEDGIVAKYGVPPSAIADYLGLVGDSSDGYPGLSGWGPKSAAAVLARYGSIEAIPDEARKWEVTVRGADRLAATLRDQRDIAMLCKDLATLRLDAEVGSVDDLEWRGPGPGFGELARRLGAGDWVERVGRLAARAQA